MRSCLWLLGTVFFVSSCQTSTDRALQENTDADSLMVEARRKIYHDDGTRSYAEYKPYKTVTVDRLPGYTPREHPRTKYGGLQSVKFDSTGFYHVRKADGRWWAVDPSGHAFIHIAINSLNTGDSERNQRALEEKYGNEEGWIVETVKMLRDYGFNGAGSWSDTKLVRYANEQVDRPLAYTINLNFMGSYADERGGTWQVPGHKAYPNDAIFAFDPGFETFCDRHAKQVAQYREDPNLFGYFSDNEMPFKKSAITDFLGLGEADPGHQEAKAWLNERGLAIDELTDSLRDAFRAHVAERYFSIVSSALKKYDPNHMYLGARFYSGEKHNKAFMQTAGKYMDIVSNNYYNRWTPDSVEMAEWAQWTGRPFIVTEYYTKGEDSGMPNQSGAGWIVKTQRDRGLFYQNFNLALLKSGDCVGWHYFKYQDNDPTLEGAEPSNIDSNKGIVNNYYEPWEPMLDEMEELNTRVYDLIDYLDQH